MCPTPVPAPARDEPIPTVPPTWALTYLRSYRSWTSLRVHAITDSRQHLWMAWNTFKPSKRPIFKRIRGITILCGWVWFWANPHVLEQWDYGDSFHHTFRIDLLRPADPVWYYLFTPLGPYDLQCQGPLVYVAPLEETDWTSDVFIGTREKGVYHSKALSGPGEPQPIWETVNLGLGDLRVWQLCPDPSDPVSQHYAIAGPADDRILYRRRPLESLLWQPILTPAQGDAATGGSGGFIQWLTTSTARISHLYVLFASFDGGGTVWLLRSADYGDSWTAFTIVAGEGLHDPGNLTVGVGQGGSPHPAGDVLYATIQVEDDEGTRTYFSFDHGATWLYSFHTGGSLWTARCLVDPTDQGICWMGGWGIAAARRGIYRSINHGTSAHDVSLGHSLGTFTEVFPANAWIDPDDGDFIRILQDDIVWSSSDFALSWDQHGTTSPACQIHVAAPQNRAQLYLARNSSAPGPGAPGSGHVFFVSSDDGAYQYGKSGPAAHRSDGGGDSIPFDCGGVCHDGIMLTLSL